jgi:hypothetical protein
LKFWEIFWSVCFFIFGQYWNLRKLVFFYSKKRFCYVEIAPVKIVGKIAPAARQTGRVAHRQMILFKTQAQPENTVTRGNQRSGRTEGSRWISHVSFQLRTNIHGVFRTRNQLANAAHIMPRILLDLDKWAELFKTTRIKSCSNWGLFASCRCVVHLVVGVPHQKISEPAFWILGSPTIILPASAIFLFDPSGEKNVCSNFLQTIDPKVMESDPELETKIDQLLSREKLNWFSGSIFERFLYRNEKALRFKLLWEALFFWREKTKISPKSIATFHTAPLFFWGSGSFKSKALRTMVL